MHFVLKKYQLKSIAQFGDGLVDKMAKIETGIASDC